MADDVKAIVLKFPFSQREYMQKDNAGRVELLKELIRANLPDVCDFDWNTFRVRFEQTAPVLSTCEHEMACTKLCVLLEAKDKEIATLRERMEDLCAEMEKVAKGEGRKFIFGPGTTEETGHAE